MTEKEKMAAGELYNPEDQQLLLERKHARQLIRQYNETPEDDAVRTGLLTELLGSV
ncbi:acetyltransferase, partial [Pseudomonas sp. GW456-E7]